MSSWSLEALDGLRAAETRRAVVEYLDGQDCCRSAQEIHDGIAADGGAVGVASVYRALDTLAELRLVQRVDAGDGIARFEPARSDDHHHHHLVCVDCGKVSDFTLPTGVEQSLDQALRRAARKEGYRPDAHRLDLTGTCPDCQAV